MIDRQSMVVAAVLVVMMNACGSTHNEPESPTKASASVAASPFDNLQRTGENGGPQSRMYKGGKLEIIEYFYDAQGALPPGELPASVLLRIPQHKDVTVAPKYTGDYEITVDQGPDGKEKRVIGKVRLYEPTYNGPSGPENLCEGQKYEVTKAGQRVSIPELTGKAIAYEGYWDVEHGQYHTNHSDGHKPFILSCATGVVAKCMLRGYLPSSNKALFDACLYASRSQRSNEPAERVALTCNGTIVDIYDQQGIQTFDRGLDASYTFEAAWNAQGILCSNHPRYSGCATNLDGIPKCPEDVANGSAWKFGDKDILLKTRSAMVEKDCPGKDEATVQKVCTQ